MAETCQDTGTFNCKESTEFSGDRIALARYHRHMRLPSIPFVVLDTETTGLTPRVHRIIEFASVRLEDGEIADTYEQLFFPEHDEVPPTVVALTRIRSADVQGKPTFAEKRVEILEHIGSDTLIVGQNVNFDLQMLKGEGIDLTDRPWIDTSMLASLVFPELASYSLGYVSTVLQLNHEPVHRALGDVRATLELLERCWERLQEVPATILQDRTLDILSRSSRGYQMLFSALPKSTASTVPEWLTSPALRYDNLGSTDRFPLHNPENGSVHLQEESLDPAMLERIIATAVEDTSTTHWIAVKNLEASLRRIAFSKDNVRVLYPPFLILNPEAQAALLAQETFTADEATLATKLLWYEPTLRDELPLHGDEKAIWSGKMICTEESKEYIEQFQNLPSVILLDHWQMLSFLADPEHAAHGALSEKAHIIIDDASMLEDTATRAYGKQCSVNDLRAASEGDTALTRFTDLLQLWIEKTRHMQDIRYLTPMDFETPDVQGLRQQLDQLLKERTNSDRLLQLLESIAFILDPKNLHQRIVYIEQRQDGSQSLISAPEFVHELLREYLYDRYPVTLLIPSGSSETLTEILPRSQKTVLTELDDDSGLAIEFPEKIETDTVFVDPPAGKTVVLASSKRVIQQIFEKYVEPLEKLNVHLICQGMSGGQGRMQAEFMASPGDTIMVITPWTFEGIELEPRCIDRLILQALPFDHPSHAIFSKRAEHYQDAFQDYSLPRLEHRLFRILRTFCRYKTSSGEVIVQDSRLQNKSYGKRVRAYLESFNREEEDATDTPPQQTLF